MSKTMKAILDGLFFGISSGIATLTGALLEMPKGSALSDVGEVTWLIAALFVVGGAIKSWRGYLIEKKND